MRELKKMVVKLLLLRFIVEVPVHIPIALWKTRTTLIKIQNILISYLVARLCG